MLIHILLAGFLAMSLGHSSSCSGASCSTGSHGSSFIQKSTSKVENGGVDLDESEDSEGSSNEDASAVPYKSLGCFANDEKPGDSMGGGSGRRAVRLFFKVSSTMTVERCYWHCRRKGAAIFALERYNECRCSDTSKEDMLAVLSPLPVSQCNTFCGGGGGICGGVKGHAASIFEAKDPPPEESTVTGEEVAQAYAEKTGTSVEEYPFHKLDTFEILETEGMLLHQGDMAVHIDVLPEGDLKTALLQFREGRAAGVTNSSALAELRAEVQRVGQPGKTVASATPRAYNNAEVPYKWDGSCHGATKSVWRKAMGWWEKHTCIRFKENGAPHRGKFLKLMCTECCWAHLGSVTGAKANINSGANIANAAHELGHSLGLSHTQSRYDRESHVEVMWSTVRSALGDSMMSQYWIEKGAVALAPYRFDDLMHYSWVWGGHKMFKAKRPAASGESFAESQYLSSSDIENINLFYKCGPNGSPPPPNSGGPPIGSGPWELQKPGSTSCFRSLGHNKLLATGGSCTKFQKGSSGETFTLKVPGGCVDYFHGRGFGVYSCHGGANQLFFDDGGKLCVDAVNECFEIYGSKPAPPPTPPPPRPTPQPTPAHTSPGGGGGGGDGGLWPQYGADKSKCGGAGDTVSSQEACQERAVASGFDFYQYEPDSRKCMAKSTCSSPVSTKWNWKIFKRAASAPDPTPVPTPGCCKCPTSAALQMNESAEFSASTDSFDPAMVKLGLATSTSVHAVNAAVRVTFDTQVDRSAGDELVLLRASSGLDTKSLATELFPEVVPRASSSTKAGVLTLMLNPCVSPDVLFRTPYIPVAPGKYSLAYDSIGKARVQGAELELLPSKPTQPGRALLTWVESGLRISWRVPLFNGGAKDGSLLYQVSAKASTDDDEELFVVEAPTNENTVTVPREDVEKCPSTESGKLGCVFQVRAKNPTVDEWSAGGWWSEPIASKN